MTAPVANVDLRLSYARVDDGPLAVGDLIGQRRVVGFAFSARSIPPDRLADRVLLDGDENWDSPSRRLVPESAYGGTPSAGETVTRSGASPVESLPPDRLHTAPPSLGTAFENALAAMGPAGELVAGVLADAAARRHEAWLVGGATRDLLDRDGGEVNDMDFTGTVGPGEFSEIAYRQRRRAALTDHVWRVSLDLVCSLAPYDAPQDRLLEYKPLSLRTRPSPMWGGDLASDAVTRDLTVNSLYYDHRHDILIDPTGVGLTHLDRPRVLATRNRPDVPVDQAVLILRFLKFGLRWGDADRAQIGTVVRDMGEGPATSLTEAQWRSIARLRERCVPADRRGADELLLADSLGPAAVGLVRALQERPS